MRVLALIAIALGATVLAAEMSAEATVRMEGNALCPSYSDRVPFRHDSAVHRRLVPGQPNRVLLCRYHGLNARVPLGLIRARALPGAARARHLAKLFDRLRRFPPGAIVCPADFERDIVARFRYRHAPDDYVRVDLTGCPSATNGPLTRAAWYRPGQRLVHALNRLI